MESPRTSSSRMSSSRSSLSDIDSLKVQLEEQNQLLRQSGEYGIKLMEDNKELTRTMEESERKHLKSCEALKEEIYSLTQKTEQKTRMEAEYQEELDNMKKQLLSQRDDLKALHQLTDQSALISHLKIRLREMEASSDSSESEIKRLTALTKTQEERMAESAEKIKLLQENIKEAAPDEISSLLKQLELSTTRQEKLRDELVMKDNELINATQQLHSYQNRLEMLQQELTEANTQLSSVSNSFLACSQENQELRCEMDMLRTQDRDHQKKGNSMFTELDDKRQEAEKKLLSLTVQYDSLQSQHTLSKKQITKLKMKMSDVLRMASGQVDSLHVAELERQLHESRAEIQVLNTKLNKAKTGRMSILPAPQPEAASNGTDRKTLAFTANLLKTKEQEIVELSRELKEKRLRATYDTQTVNEAQHKLREMESKAKKLHAQNIKLNIQLDELKSKQQGGSEGGSSKLEKATEEVIPDYNPELAGILLGGQANPLISCKQSSAEEQEQKEVDPLIKTESRSRLNAFAEVNDNTSNTSEPAPSKPAPAHLTSLYARRLSSQSMDSLMSCDGQENAKSCDSAIREDEQKKVIHVKVDDGAANSCPTQ